MHLGGPAPITKTTSLSFISEGEESDQRGRSLTHYTPLVTPEGEESEQKGRSLTWTLSSQGLTALKLSSTVTSYMTTTPSAFRKNCLVMLRYLQRPRATR